MKRMHILSLALVLASLTTSPTAASVASARHTPKDKEKRSAVRRRPAQRRGNTQPVEVTYTCPMHHDVHLKSPGECPKCGMDLEVEKPGK
jgi:hypothetical protein